MKLLLFILGACGGIALVCFGVMFARAWLRDRREHKRWAMDPVRPIRRLDGSLGLGGTGSPRKGLSDAEVRRIFDENFRDFPFTGGGRR